MPNGRSILLVEDEPLLANLLKKRLEKEGYSVQIAGDGQSALDLLKSNKFNLILLDIILPKVSGFELMENIRQDPGYANAPIIVISNLGQEGDIEKGKRLGAVGYFVKAHVSIEDLVSQIKKFLTDA